MKSSLGARRPLAALALFVLTCAAPAGTARAADINGAWASDAKACDRIFQKKKSAFARGTDTNGSGFILDGNNIRGRIANCKIKTRKQDGDTVHLVAACATDVM